MVLISCLIGLVKVGEMLWIDISSCWDGVLFCKLVIIVLFFRVCCICMFG